MVIKQECFFLVDVAWNYTAGATAKVLTSKFFSPLRSHISVKFALGFAKWHYRSSRVKYPPPDMLCPLAFFFSRMDQRGGSINLREEKRQVGKVCQGGIISQQLRMFSLRFINKPSNFWLCASPYFVRISRLSKLSNTWKTLYTQVST